MVLSEDKINHIAHLLIDTIWKNDHVDYTDEDEALREAKRVIKNFISLSEEVDQSVRHKIQSQKKVIPEGSREWDILYHKYFDEEMHKKGM